MGIRAPGSPVLLALVVAGAVAAPLAAQSNETAALRVTVVDAATGQPVAGAQVGFPELGMFVLADNQGVARIVRIPPGARTLEVTMLGYGKATTTMLLEAHALATGVVALTTDPIEIEGLTVTASRQIERLRSTGFYQRERMGIGHQLGPLELSSMIALQPGDFLTMIPSVEVITGAFGKKTVESRRSCASLSSNGIATPPGPAQGMGFGTRAGPFQAGPGGNAMAIYLDGAPYYDELASLPVDMIDAMEVYVGSQVPVQWSSVGNRGHCGVLLIWSK